MNKGPIRSVPDAVAEKVRVINKELHPHGWREGQPTPRLIPYLMKERAPDFQDWRCRLVDEDDNTLAECLQWEQLHWHVVSMFLTGFQARRLKDFRAGMQHAVDKLHENNQRSLGLIR